MNRHEIPENNSIPLPLCPPKHKNKRNTLKNKLECHGGHILRLITISRIRYDVTETECMISR